jgi:hypothetical protein
VTLKKHKPINQILRRLKDQSQAHPERHSVVLIYLIGFIASFAYTMYPEDNHFQNFWSFNWQWLHLQWEDFSINMRAHVYYIGERFRHIINAYLIGSLIPCWQMEVIFWMEVIYLYDYLLFFNNTEYGRFKGIAWITVLIITGFLNFISRWKKQL